jgi:hypothetical protein
MKGTGFFLGSIGSIFSAVAGPYCGRLFEVEVSKWSKV